MAEEKLSDEQYFAQRAAALKEQAEQGYPEAWRPENEGDNVIGVLVAKDKGHTQQYGEQDIAVLEHPVKKVRIAIWLLHEVLRNQFRRANPQIGELVCVVYKGKVTPKAGGNDYVDYSVTVDRPVESARPVSWGEEPPQAERAGRRATDPEVAAEPVAVGSAQQSVWGEADADFAGADSDIPFAPSSYNNFI